MTRLSTSARKQIRVEKLARMNHEEANRRLSLSQHSDYSSDSRYIFLLFIIMLLYLFFKYLFRAIFSPKICLPSGKTISSGKNDAEFVPQTSIDAGNA